MQALIIFSLLFQTAIAQVADVELSAKVDQTEISQDESVSLKLTVDVKSGNPNLEDPDFTAPEFDIINQFQNTQIQSVYENGRFQMKHQRQYTFLLRPKKSGLFSISNISIIANGKKITAPAITMRVDKGGQGNAAFSQSPSGVGTGSLRGIPKSGSGREPFFIRAETNKSSVYKGEQVIVSYYLYRKTRVFNIQVAQYPVLNSFLREDLEIPVMGTQLQTEETIVGGVPYQRSLLARYAAYPLKEGEQKIDSMAIKANYYPLRSQGSRLSDDDDTDPFQNFFGAFNASQMTQRSPQVNVKVLPLPTNGKPNDFSGAVGNFEVSSSVDKSTVKVNDALNLVVRVEGRGNVASVELPQVTWPKGVEMYESKGNAKTGRGGVSEKVFEVLLIPRSGGKLMLPQFEFSFYDPEKKEYVSKKTNPLEIQIDGPVLTDDQLAPQKQTVNSGETKGAANGGDAKNPTDLVKISFSWRDLLNKLSFLKYLFIGLLVAGLGWLGLDFSRRIRAYVSRKRSSIDASFRTRVARLRQKSAQMNTMSDQEKRLFLDECEAVFLDELERKTDLSVRGLPRANLKSILTERGIVREENWSEIQKILDQLDHIRFSGGQVNADSSLVLDQIAKFAEKF
ncbi:MAG: protein BatD [Xanthomonadaceae bacterium]|nr:protein BatD [Xanthomonadaceae bacterium]